MRIPFLFCLLLAFSSVVSAQTVSNLWSTVADKNLPLAETAERAFVPNAYSAFKLSFGEMKNHLKAAPREWTQAGNEHPLKVQLPNSDGTIETFAITESPLLSENDQLKNPDVKTYTGYSLDTPGKMTRFSHTMLGFHGVTINSAHEIEFIEPIAKNQDTYYMVYKMDNFPEELIPNATCGNDQSGDHSVLNSNTSSRSPNGVLVKLKIYKFACATTGEFAEDHGGTAASVLAAMTNYINTLNAIYEFELHTRLIFVDNVASIFFLDKNTDPYSGVTVFDWAGQNTSAMTGILGANGYDVGHVFARYNSGPATGVASGRFCTQQRGQACSAGNPPYGVGFIKTVGHEIGHQWSAGHTWNFCDNTFANGQYAAGSAFEPGSGSTIMSYAGACGSANIVNGATENYYHSGSIDQIRNYIENSSGSTCGTEMTTTNHHPEVTLAHAATGIYIPISTPYQLTGSATDMDNDILTYCWEGMDLGIQVPLGDQGGSSPLVRSYPPSATGATRVIPRLSAVIANQIPAADLLPTYSREIKMRLTVRDNKAGGGGVGKADISLRSTDQAGPFLVTTPNTLSDTWVNGLCQKVTWDVANTDKMPVNCQKVHIRLSTDGGQTYPTTLATNEPNDGVAYVQVPAGVLTNNGRVRIDAADNVFFDISNANFKIINPTTPTYSLCSTIDAAVVCLPSNFSTSYTVGAVSGFTGAVNLAVASGLPSGAVASFSNAAPSVGETANLLIDMGNVTTEGNFTITVTATSGTQVETREINLTIYSNIFTAFALQTPANGAINVVQAPTLTWATIPDANTYDLELASSPSFATNKITVAKQDLAAGTWPVSILLDKGKTYYWRVRPSNECGKGAWSEPFAFATVNEVCTASAASDLPKNITTSANSTAISQVFITGGAISDLNVKKVGIYHDFFRDLTFQLISPSGTTITLVEDKCGNSSGNFTFGFDDSAPDDFKCPPSTAGIAYRPSTPLATFNGTNAMGIWKLQVSDSTASSGGTLQSFELEICATAALNAPILVKNLTLDVQGGSNALITSDLLKAEDADDAPSDIRYTLMTIPVQGHLQNNTSAPLQPGSTFTQEEINNGNIRYYHYGSGALDHFKFIIEDPKGGFYGTPEFNIQPLNVSLDQASPLQFSMQPSPATTNVSLFFADLVTKRLNLEIYAVDGKQVAKESINPGVTIKQIDISQFATGLYIVRLTDGNNQFTSKFVKQ
jgi:subtilisin-like proprotein convertase family protein